MKIKRTAIASAIALTLASGSVLAKTTTVSGEFIFDRTRVEVGGTVNLALLGLNVHGEVDMQGEQEGSTIQATVNSSLGEVMGGSETQDADPLKEGHFAASVKYVKLTEGKGKVHIKYSPEISGEDTVEVALWERIPNLSGGFELKRITGTTTQNVTINPPPTDPEGLGIMAFYPASSDPRGMADCFLIEPQCSETDDGIYGEVTAGHGGGEVVVLAYNPNAAGTVTITLNLKGEKEVTHSYTGEMVQGQAVVPVGSEITKAGEYYMKATMDGFDGSSVQLVYPDILKVWSTGIPAKLKLWASKERVAMPDFSQGFFANDQIVQGTDIWVRTLDEYDNPTTVCYPQKDPTTGMTRCQGGDDIHISIQDSSGVVSPTALNLYVPANSQDGKSVPKTSNAVLGDENFEIINVGMASLVAQVQDVLATPTTTGGVGMSSSGIAPSEPLEIQVVADSLAVDVRPSFLIEQLAGTEFEAFEVTVINNRGQTRVDTNLTPIKPDKVVVENLCTNEEITLEPDSRNIVKALFRKQCEGEETRYLVSDLVGNYGQMVVDAAAILPAAATTVEFHNAHGEKLEDVPPHPITEDKQYYTVLPEVAFKIFDEFGNMFMIEMEMEDEMGEVSSTGGTTTPLEVSDQTSEQISEQMGEFRVLSSNGEIVYNTPEGGYGIPSRFIRFNEIASAAAVVYDAVGPNAFPGGQDLIVMSFTKPGLEEGLNLTTTIPRFSGLTSIKSYLEAPEQTIPVNSEVAMTVEVLDEDGDIFLDPNPGQSVNVTMTIQPTEGSLVKPTLTEIIWVEKSLTPEQCQTVGGIFANNMCVTEVPLTMEQCQQVDGMLMGDQCVELMTRSLSSGQVLDFSETEGRKILVVNGGPEEGEFEVTFTHATLTGETVTETRTIKVGKSERQCEPGSEVNPCYTEETCTQNMGIWTKLSLVESCQASDGLVAASFEDSNYPYEDPERAKFSGGVLKTKEGKEGSYKKTDTIALASDVIKIAGVLKADSEHIGKAADIVVVFYHEHPSYERGYRWFFVRACAAEDGDLCRSMGWVIEPLNYGEGDLPDLAGLRPLKRLEALPEYQLLNLYNGHLFYKGKMEIFVGYLINTEEELQYRNIIFNAEPITINIE